MTEPDHLFVVGAGFSRHAGLPLASEFTENLLDTAGLSESALSSEIVPFLKKFVEDAFGHGQNSKPTDWPYLEDIFTCIDLSANSGHHLGKSYSPSDLRTVRRALIVRIILMLTQKYKQRSKAIDENWERLERFFSSVACDKCAFLSMNWDTVIENGLARTQKVQSFDYACDARRVRIKSRTELELIPVGSEKAVRILKPHGSTNWFAGPVAGQTHPDLHLLAGRWVGTDISLSGLRPPLAHNPSSDPTDRGMRHR